MISDPTKDALIFEISARIEEFEQAIEEQFKPALRKAIVDVMAEFITDPIPGITLKAEVE